MPPLFHRPFRRAIWLDTQEEEIPADLLETQPWLQDHLRHSVTELEILHGVLNDPKMADRSIFYFRDPAYLTHLPAGENPADFAVESPAAAEKLADLKKHIREGHASGTPLPTS